ncbi:MAG: asparagine synthetase B, partial [Deltaproteobacteria bacterium]|nr:asparagine synthetase B [Deltaproteobacteria bacterium]
MCGIAGVVSLNGAREVPLHLLRQMAGALRHRGPDEAGIYVDDAAGLAHVRLSIIDLASGTQPIHNEDETLWIVYNGEVFNHLELRRDLQAKGHRFYTAADTEVILHLYEEKGPGCVEDLNGQFAFALWDTKEQTLFAA